MANLKPFVAVACVCENVLIEPDNVASVIRIVDTFHLQTGDKPPPSGITPVVRLNAFVSVKSGDVTGQHEIGIVLRQPNGKRREIQKWPVVLNGGEHGANLKIQFDLGKPEMGLYWFDVIWGEDVLTSIPFRLKLVEASVEGKSPST